jgi:hypothetical protein
LSSSGLPQAASKAHRSRGKLEVTEMDTSESVFWQRVILIVFLVPYFIGIGISAIHTWKQQRSELLRKATQHLKKTG